MPTDSKDKVKQVKRNVWEYKKFLALVKQKKIEHAVIYAKALGIQRRTLVHWLSQPELHQALLDSIDGLVDGMKKAGVKDWRMYRELLEILGIDKEQKIDLTSDGQKIQPAQIIDLGNIANVSDKSETEPSSPSSQE